MAQWSGQIDEKSKTIPLRGRIATGWLLGPHFRGYLRGSQVCVLIILFTFVFILIVLFEVLRENSSARWVAAQSHDVLGLVSRRGRPALLGRPE